MAERRAEGVHVELTVILSDAAVAAPAGTARFGAQLTAALIEEAPHPWTVGGYTHRLSPIRRSQTLARLEGLDSLAESVLPRSLLGRAWELPVSGPRADVVLAPSLFAPLAGRGLHRKGRLIVTVHDLVPFTHPQLLSPHGARWHRRQIRRAQRWADAILVPTEAVAAALEHYAPASGRVHVVAGAASPILLSAGDSDPAPGASDPYVLFVGTLEPRKGLDLLIAAMAHPAMSSTATAPARLVITGAPGWGGVSVDDYARAAGLSPARLHVTGRVDDGQLAALLRGARTLVVPSRAEGFGLPVVEAMAVGTPVIHSLDPALSETAGGAGFGVDLSGTPELAVHTLAAGIARVLTEPELQAQLGALGRQRARDFSWALSAERVWQIIDS